MYKLKDIMEMLNIPERTIRRHINQQILKGNKVGGVWYFTEEEIGNYLSNASIKDTHKRNMMREIIDYTNGFTKNKNDIVLSINTKKLTRKELKEITTYLSNSKHPFKFSANVVSNQHNITFIGQQSEAIYLIHQLGDQNE